jgi:hypothetical protein
MTESRNDDRPQDEKPGEEEQRDVRHAGGGRTSGETSVDDDLGRGD